MLHGIREDKRYEMEVVEGYRLLVLAFPRISWVIIDLGGE